MARTKASVATKVATGKSSKAKSSSAPAPSSAVSSNSSNEKTSRSYSGGNPVCPRETPNWQKPITNFFITNKCTKSDDEEDNNVKASSSNYKPKRNVIQSDDEEELTEVPKNKELEESIVLEPLNGEECHKIEEYYTSVNEKGKEKSSNSESKTNRIKRSLEEVTLGEESGNVKKKVKSC